MISTEALAARREYKRNWAKRNPDKIKAQQERYWAKRAASAAQTEPAPAQMTTAPAEG